MNVDDDLVVLIEQRRMFETFIFNQLQRDQMMQIVFVEDSDIPEDFWEPVKVGLTPEQFTDKILYCDSDQRECLICCNDTVSQFGKVPCCKNQFCIDCMQKWFGESVYCPFCKVDIRES